MSHDDKPRERKKGHSALRVRDGKLEVFDPNPTEADAAAKAWLEFVATLPVIPPDAEEGFKAGWHAALRSSRSASGELEALWHFSTCPYDHCQRCCDEEGIIKGIRDKMAATDSHGS